MPEIDYIGQELDIFEKAVNWKNYWSRTIAPWISGDVLEVGAGNGCNTAMLRQYGKSRWVCLEPDAKLMERIALRQRAGEIQGACECVTGTLADIPTDAKFDTILYIDVIEHIPDDDEEMRRAEEHLKPGGNLIILAPAHQWLYSPFDKSIGHFRRYNKKMMRQLPRHGLQLTDLFYLDSVGLLASTGNRLLLQQSMPNAGQIGFWDRCLVPCSRVLDPLLMKSIGKSVIGVWRMPGKNC